MSDLKADVIKLMGAYKEYEQRFDKEVVAVLIMMPLKPHPEAPFVKKVQDLIDGGEAGKAVLAGTLKGFSGDYPMEQVLFGTRAYRKVLEKGQEVPDVAVRNMEGRQEGILIEGQNMYGEYYSLWQASEKVGEWDGDVVEIEDRGQGGRHFVYDAVVWAEKVCN